MIDANNLLGSDRHEMPGSSVGHFLFWVAVQLPIRVE